MSLTPSAWPFGPGAFRGERPLEGDEDGLRDEGREEEGREEGRASERRSERDEEGLLEEGPEEEGRDEGREPERLREGDDEAASEGRGGDKERDEGRGSTMRTTRRPPLGRAAPRPLAEGVLRTRRPGEGSCRTEVE